MNETIQVWVDGSCHKNPGVGGWGWHDNLGNQGTGGEKQTTNNRMEMTAILEALKTYPDGTKVKVYSDSQYCVNGLTTWRPKWQKANWHKKAIKQILERELDIDFSGDVKPTIPQPRPTR